MLLPTDRGIGISRKIEDEEERNRLKEIADEIKPEGMGLIIRTAARGADYARLKLDLDRLLEIWNEIERKAKSVKAPSLLFSDEELTLRVVRNLLGREIEEIVVDSDQGFLKLKELVGEKDVQITLYSDKEPMFVHYDIESQIQRALRNKIWLDCRGFLIIDQTEALSIIDVNTGKFTGKDSLKHRPYYQFGSCRGDSKAAPAPKHRRHHHC